MIAANRKQAMVPEGAIALDPVGTAPGLVVPDGERGRGRPARARRASCSRCGRRRWRRRRCSAVLERATPLHGYTLRMFGIPESEIAKSLREIEEEGVALPGVEITTCLRRGEIEIDVRYRDGAAATAEAVRAGLAERHPSAPLQRRRRDDRLPGREAARRAPARPGRVLQRRPAGGADHRPARRLRLHGGRRRRLLERGEGGAARRRPRPDRAHGAVSPEVAEAMAIGALERFGADVAVAITGIAGPDGGSEEKPVGYVCFNARLADGTAIAREPVIPGGRDDIRERSALVGMHLLRLLLSGAEAPL